MRGWRLNPRFVRLHAQVGSKNSNNRRAIRWRGFLGGASYKAQKAAVSQTLLCKARLTDTRFSSQKHQSAVTFSNGVQATAKIVQLLLASDQIVTMCRCAYFAILVRVPRPHQ